LPKGGASQVHPHLQATIDDVKYYGQFETIRNGAEDYFLATQNNYFNDFLKIHKILGLTYQHRDAILIVPLVSAALLRLRPI
jgi:hypothetical protein